MGEEKMGQKQTVTKRKWPTKGSALNPVSFEFIFPGCSIYTETSKTDLTIIPSVPLSKLCFSLSLKAI